MLNFCLHVQHTNARIYNYLLYIRTTYIYIYTHVYLHAPNVIKYNIITCRFISRCLIINFKMSRLENGVGLFSHLIDELIPKSSNVIGLLIGLCKVFIEEGIDDVNQNILPSINEALSTAVLPRVHISYAVLIWFVLKLI